MTPFPLYDEVLYLVNGIIVTGAGAFHAAAATQSMQAMQSMQATQSSASMDNWQDQTQDDAGTFGAGNTLADVCAVYFYLLCLLTCAIYPC